MCFTLSGANQPSAGRAAGHAALDILTLGLWELVGTPIEGAASDELAVTVDYDRNDRVTKVTAAP